MPLHHTFLHEFLPVLILSFPSPLSVPSMRSCSSRSHAVDDDKVAACSSLIQSAAALAAGLPVACSPLAVPSPTPRYLVAISSGTRSCLLHTVLPRQHLRLRSPTGGGPRGCLPPSCCLVPTGGPVTFHNIVGLNCGCSILHQRF
ncbi:hypothetical protein SEVIR_8G059200v4 [Setaria viridis]|uniref:Bifunctional inhibitor/plant lipid transfer protein/seed storage helical domain-containing protein n=1 Tax=Setaria viridis TaxID=4556 RepID=A0A4U6TC92_SETVI|nr:hypothetical protein SEVIR_8G059200v2 [Setaria viridis]